jgi:heme oxygenase
VNDAVMAPQPVSFSSFLRLVTRDEHAWLDSVLRAPDRLRSEADFARLLIAWDTVWAEVRTGVQHDRRPAGHDERARLLVSAVRALQRLHADLAQLGYGSGMRAAADGRPAMDVEDVDSDLTRVLTCEPGVWAVSYVLRGARVCGGHLASQISERLELPLGIATTYHSDEAIGPSWASFRHRLDVWGRIARGTDREQAVVAVRQVIGIVGVRLEASLPPPGRS